MPDFHTVERILETWDVPLNDGGTGSRKEYVVLLRDDRYWLSDDEKLAPADSSALPTVSTSPKEGTR